MQTRSSRRVARARARPIRRAALAALLLGVGSASSASAHPEGITLSALWVAAEGLRLQHIAPDRFFASDRDDGTPEDATPLDAVSRGFVIRADGTPCPLRGETVVWRLPDIGSRRFIMHFDCPDTYRALSLEDRLAATSDPGHENFVEVSVAGRRWTEILTPARATLVIPVDAISAKSGQPIAARLPVARTLAPNLSSFLALGVEHILFGLDHVLFILALFLVCRGARSLLTIVSAFTLGHSITLALSALGCYSLLPKVAESIIALSVVYLGVENLVALRRPGRRVASANEPDAPRHRWLIALLFGLIHGFGFSYVLRDVGLPEDAMLGSLVGFNVGVEIGQVLILSALVPLVALLGRRFSYVRVATVLSALIALVGSWWLIERTLL